jgi:hypothetical protein
MKMYGIVTSSPHHGVQNQSQKTKFPWFMPWAYKQSKSGSQTDGRTDGQWRISGFENTLTIETNKKLFTL